VLTDNEKRHIPSLEEWGKTPFESQRDFIEAFTDSEYSNKQNPSFKLAVQSKLLKPDTWSVGTPPPRKQYDQREDRFGSQPAGNES
jgi:hypothetical protein